MLDGGGGGSDAATHFPYAEDDRLSASPADVLVIADDIEGTAGNLEALNPDLDTAHRPAVTGTVGVLHELSVDAPTETKNNVTQVLLSTLCASGATRLFGTDGVRAYNNLVDDIRAEYDRRRAEIMVGDCGVAAAVYPPGSSPAEIDQIDSDRASRVADARSTAVGALIRELQVRQDGYKADPLDAQAVTAASRLESGPTDETIQAIYAAGGLPLATVTAFPQLDLRLDAGRLPSDLAEMSHAELVAYLGAHPEIALAPLGLPAETVTDVEVERRMERLRDEGLLSEDDPGGLYEEWIRNTVENDVSIDTVIAIARDHDIRPESFDVLRGLEEITDNDGKSFFVLDPDMSGDEARDAVLMTYILNAGTGYENGDYAPTPYSSEEFQRIVDRSHDNSWFSYSMDVGFVHRHGGTLVTTPNGMLMGGGGDWVQEQYSLNGGTTWGDIFMVNDVDADELREYIEEGEAPNDDDLDLDRLLHHEEIHSQQWARYGYADFAARYIDASTDVTWPGWGPFRVPVIEERDPCDNEYEQEAGLEDGGYDGCPSQPYNGPEGEDEPADDRDEEGDLGYEWYVDNEAMPRCVLFNHALDRGTHLHLSPADEEEHELV
jgi:hypothetical protein